MDYSDLIKMLLGFPEKESITIEDAKEEIKKNSEIMPSLEIKAMITGLAQILIDKGIITEKEYLDSYSNSLENWITEEAKKLLKLLTGNN